MPPAKLGINLQTLVIFLIILRFPHLFLLTTLLMDSVRCLQSDAVVRALAIVKEDEALNLLQGLLIRLKRYTLSPLMMPFTRSARALSVGL